MDYSSVYYIPSIKLRMGKKDVKPMSLDQEKMYSYFERPFLGIIKTYTSH